MKIADANIILRFLLNDVEELAEKAVEILEGNKIFLPNEIIAEIIYVLEKVYDVNNNEISNIFSKLLQYENIIVSDLDVLEAALDLYGRRRFDFVDALLYAYNKIKGYKIYTFDKKLNKLLKQ